MSLFRRVFHLFLALSFFVSSAWAEVPEELQNLVLTGDMNARSSVDFRSGANNVTSLVPKGTRGTVVEVRKLKRTGSYGIKMKVTQVGRNNGKNLVKKDQEIWVYYSQKDPWLKFRDPDNQTVQDPEEALTAQAKRDGESLPAVEGTVKHPSLPTREEVLRTSVDPNLVMKDRNTTEGAWCTTGTCVTQQVPVHDPKNIQQVEDVLNAMPPTPPPTQKTVNKSTPPDPNNQWANDDYILGHSNSKQTQESIRRAMSNKRGRSYGYCYRYVKRALVASGQVRKYPPGRHARDAVKDLKAQGWVNLLDDPRYKNKIKSPADVPKGAVMVTWTGESKESGDIAIKTDWGNKGGWVSEYHSPRPMMEQPKGRRKARQGKPYKMIGVMIKPS